MTRVADFPYLVALLNPYLPDATGTSRAETARLLLEHVTNGQIHDYSDASINSFVDKGLSRSAARSILGYIDKSKAQLSEYLSEIGDDQLTLIANQLKKTAFQEMFKEVQCQRF